MPRTILAALFVVVLVGCQQSEPLVSPSAYFGGGPDAREFEIELCREPDANALIYPEYLARGTLTFQLDGNPPHPVSGRCSLSDEKPWMEVPKSKAIRLPALEGDYPFNVADLGDRIRIGLCPLTSDHQLVLEFPPFRADARKVEGTWTFITIAGEAVHGPARMSYFPGCSPADY